jgi:hypothetical protein
LCSVQMSIFMVGLVVTLVQHAFALIAVIWIKQGGRTNPLSGIVGLPGSHEYINISINIFIYLEMYPPIYSHLTRSFQMCNDPSRF